MMTLGLGYIDVSIKTVLRDGWWMDGMVSAFNACGSDKSVNRFGNGRLSLIFSLAKIISNSAFGLVGYYLSRLNIRDNRPSPHRLTDLSDQQPLKVDTLLSIHHPSQSTVFVLTSIYPSPSLIMESDHGKISVN